MYTIIETPLFASDAHGIWREDGRADFCVWFAKIQKLATLFLGLEGVVKYVGHIEHRVNAEELE